MCECNCHKLGAALCGACCFHEEVIKEKNKYTAYPHPTDMLFKRVDKLELLVGTMLMRINGEEDLIRKVSNELDQDLSLAIKRIDTLSDIKNDYRREVGSIEHSVEHLQEGIEKCFERIEKLEKENDMRRDTISCVDSAYDKAYEEIYERLDKLEKWKEAAIEKNIQDNQRMKELERFQNITYEQFRNVALKRAPHKCPVCEGNPSGSISSYIGGERQVEKIHCHACEGKGIVWG